MYSNIANNRKGLRPPASQKPHLRPHLHLLASLARPHWGPMASRYHLRHVGEKRGQGVQGMVPEILKFSAQLFPHLGVNFGNSQRVRLVSQEVAIISGLKMNLQI